MSAAFVLMSHSAEARSRYHHAAKQHHGVKKVSLQVNKYRLSRSVRIGKKFSHAKRHRIASSRSVSLAGVTPVLASKARQIASDCGSSIISAVSRRGIRSNHPAGRAVDMRGNPSCIYAHLKGWPGGYSTDYAAVSHVHISYNPGGQEWGMHFTHGGGHSYRRYAAGGSRRHVARSFARADFQQSGVQQSSPVAVATLHKPQ
jgi:hypothetical protein